MISYVTHALAKIGLNAKPSSLGYLLSLANEANQDRSAEDQIQDPYYQLQHRVEHEEDYVNHQNHWGEDDASDGGC